MADPVQDPVTPDAENPEAFGARAAKLLKDEQGNAQPIKQQRAAWENLEVEIGEFPLLSPKQLLVGYGIAGTLLLAVIGGIVSVVLTFLLSLFTGGNIGILLFAGIVGTTVSAVAGALIVIGLFILYESTWYPTVETDEVAILNWFNKPIHENAKFVADNPTFTDEDGKEQLNKLAPLKPGQHIAVWPYSLDRRKVQKHESTIPKTKIAIQNPQLLGSTDEQERSKALSTIVFGGQINLVNDVSDIRSLLIADRIDGGMSQITKRLNTTLITEVTSLAAGEKGFRDYLEALAFNESIRDWLELRLIKDLVNTATIVETFSPVLTLPDELVKAIDAARVEGAEADKETKNTQTLMTMWYMSRTGDMKPTPAKLKKFYANPENQMPKTLGAYLIGKSNKTLGADAKLSVIESGDPIMNILQKGKEALGI